MRKLIVLGLLLALLVAPVQAQDDDSGVPDDVLDRLEQLIVRAEAAAERAEAAAIEAAERMAESDQAVDDAQEILGLAVDMFGLFEAMSGVIMIFVPLLALVAGFVGFNRLNNASEELR